jgi:hypothetical protein
MFTIQNYYNFISNQKQSNSFANEVQIASKFGVKHEGRQLILNSRPETIRKSIEGRNWRFNRFYLSVWILDKTMHLLYQSAQNF